MPNDRRGHIGQDKKGRYFARTTITDEKGKRRNIIRLAKDKTEARQILKTILRQFDEEGSRSIDIARLTFNHLADFYELHYLKPARFVGGRKVAGLRDWKHVRAFLKIFRAEFGRRLLREITYSDIRPCRAERLKTPTQYGRQRSVTAVNRELACLRRIFNIAVRESWLVKNPFNCGDTLVSAADERKRERILTLSEEARLLEACEHP